MDSQKSHRLLSLIVKNVSLTDFYYVVIIIIIIIIIIIVIIIH